MDEQQRLNIELLKPLPRWAFEFAFPTQTVVHGLNGQSTGGACIAHNPGAATVHCGHISESTVSYGPFAL